MHKTDKSLDELLSELREVEEKIALAWNDLEILEEPKGRFTIRCKRGLADNC